MKRYFILCAVLCLGTMGSIFSQPVKTGIEVLRSQDFALLEGKKVGLITNPTGVDSRLRSTIDILYEAPNVELVRLFGPEHGVRGNAHAGDKVDGAVDGKTFGATFATTRCQILGALRVRLRMTAASVISVSMTPRPRKLLTLWRLAFCPA